MTQTVVRVVNPDELRLHFTEHMEEPGASCRLCATGKARHMKTRRAPALDLEREQERANFARELLRELATSDDA